MQYYYTITYTKSRISFQDTAFCKLFHPVQHLFDMNPDFLIQFC